MKKLLLYLVPLFGLFLFGCSEKLPSSTETTSGAIVRNVKRGMTEGEVIKAEGLDKDKITKERDGRFYFIGSETELIGKNVKIGYAFIDGKLEKVSYLLLESNFRDYNVLRRELGKKYGTGDILEEECSAISHNHSNLAQKLQEVKESNMNKQQKIAEMAEIKKNSEGIVEKIKNCLWDRDIIYFNTSAKGSNIIDMRDTYLSLGYIGYSHLWEKDNTLIGIGLKEGLFNENDVSLSLDYWSKSFEDYTIKMKESDFEQTI